MTIMLGGLAAARVGDRFAMAIIKTNTPATRRRIKNDGVVPSSAAAALERKRAVFIPRIFMLSIPLRPRKAALGHPELSEDERQAFQRRKKGWLSRKPMSRNSMG